MCSGQFGIRSLWFGIISRHQFFQFHELENIPTIIFLAHQYNSYLYTCRKPSVPKPEIQHNRRGRGVPTLTWEEVTSREGKRLCCSCSKKEIIRLRNDSKLALNQRFKKGVYPVESYMIPYATLKRLRWPTSPAEKEAAYYTGVNIQSNCWTGSILGFSPCDLIDRHWFLRRYLVMFKVSLTSGVTTTSALTSAGSQPHTSTVWPWSDVPKVPLYGT